MRYVTHTAGLFRARVLLARLSTWRLLGPLDARSGNNEHGSGDVAGAGAIIGFRFRRLMRPRLEDRGGAGFPFITRAADISGLARSKDVPCRDDSRMNRAIKGNPHSDAYSTIIFTGCSRSLGPLPDFRWIIGAQRPGFTPAGTLNLISLSVCSIISTFTSSTSFVR